MLYILFFLNNMNISLIPTPHADEYLQSQFDILAAPAFSPLWNAKLLTAAAAVLPAESNIQRGHPYLQTTQREREKRNGGQWVNKYIYIYSKREE